jgi:hypothetical protein
MTGSIDPARRPTAAPDGPLVRLGRLPEEYGMRAVTFERNGGPEVLQFKEVPDPKPRDGEVLVDVEAVGVNFMDVYEREPRGPGRSPGPGSASPGPAFPAATPNASPRRANAWYPCRKACRQSSRPQHSCRA